MHSAISLRFLWDFMFPEKIKTFMKTDSFDFIFCTFSFQAKLETKALKAKRPGFTDERYNETSYYVENGLYNIYTI